MNRQGKGWALMLPRMGLGAVVGAEPLQCPLKPQGLGFRALGV